MKGLAIIFGLYALGLAGRLVLHIPLPAGVIGMLLLLAALFTGAVKLSHIEDSAQFLLKHMLLFFAPLVVTSPLYMAGIAAEWWPAAVGFFGSALLSLLTAAWVTRLLAPKASAGEGAKR